MNLVEELLPNMRRVQSADRDLKELVLLWSVIEASSSISCPVDAEAILPALRETRERFADLQSRLVRQLGHEAVAELGDELASTAQCGIDILVRNLFERTADVGFLATDDVLRDFCAAAGEARATLRPAMVARLAAYRDKYTVYDDIVVLGPDGDVLARLDPSCPQLSTQDAVVARAMSAQGYVESYGVSDLGAGAAPALLYAHRIESVRGQRLGVLVLRFRFADELQRIFTNLQRDHRQVALVLLDPQHCVVVSNDESHVPVGTILRVGEPGRVELVTLAGREYLAMRCPTRGYQGYGGPGWSALAMVSLSTAFRDRHELTTPQEGVSLDNQELRCIQQEVEVINRNLRRVVWNGRLAADANQRSRHNIKAVLQQVSDTGIRMRDRTGLAIRDLYRTSLGRVQHQSGELARLAADIMDRNLYERANDCRWWALSPVVQRVLASLGPASRAAGPGAAGAELNAVLAHINGLYTVYTRLVVFDTQGAVCGLSNDDPQRSLLGAQVPAAWLQATRALSDAQRYAVSGFEATEFSDGVPTYTYLAAVRDGQGGRVTGGIAIVFNAQREFNAMLTDVLNGRTGVAAFVDSGGSIVACTDPRFAAGAKLPFALRTSVIDYEGAHYAVACVKTSGYREFKRKDGYDHGVHVVVALRLGALERRQQSLFDCALRPLPPRLRAGVATERRSGESDLQELAVFQVGSSRYALRVGAVLETRPQTGLVRVAHAGAHMVGFLDVLPGAPEGLLPVMCARSLFGLNYPARDTDGTVLVLADPLRPREPLLGLRVDDIISVLDVDVAHVQPAPEGLRSRAPWLGGMVRVLKNDAEGGEAIIELIDTAGLLSRLRPTQAMEAC
jgi:chemotaxis signal transduction protein